MLPSGWVIESLIDMIGYLRARLMARFWTDILQATARSRVNYLACPPMLRRQF